MLITIILLITITITIVITTNKHKPTASARSFSILRFCSSKSCAAYLRRLIASMWLCFNFLSSSFFCVWEKERERYTHIHTHTYTYTRTHTLHTHTHTHIHTHILSRHLVDVVASLIACAYLFRDSSCHALLFHSLP